MMEHQSNESFYDKKETEGDRAKIQNLGNQSDVERPGNLGSLTITLENRGIRKRSLQLGRSIGITF